MKLHPKAEELIKEFEEELACIYSIESVESPAAGITVIGPVLKLYELEGEDVILTKLNDKEYFVQKIDDYGPHIRIFKSPTEVRKYLDWDWEAKECREASEELTPEEKDKVRKLLREGRDIAYIYKTTGIAPCDIYYFAKKENLPINLPIKVEGGSERR
jgi:hypothetical protein